MSKRTRLTPLRLLIIDDEIADANLIVRAVEESGFTVESERVQSASSLDAALRRPWDAITCDWVMSGFSAPEALKILADRDIDLPVIIVSGQAAEDVTVTAMKAGAHDVVRKQKLTRLGPAIERELRDVEVRRAHRQAQAALEVSEARYRRLFETARDGIFILDAAMGRIIDANPFLTEVLGYSREELVGKQLWELGPFLDIAANQEMFRELQSRDYVRYEHLPLESRDGRCTDVEFVSNSYDVDGERVVQCNVRDISERRRSERAAHTANERRSRDRQARAEAVDLELEALVAFVSHDLRAPLRQLEQLSKVLREEHSAQLDTEGRRYVDRIEAGARRLSQLIADRLRLAQMAKAV